ncbi:MAG: ABC transporter ATP-binding protein [Firmicutes bacterium]|jgi:multiple sugar transport system ATP-binding protein|nr:ABC transporter ATP-binding protein [Bacillota bacterium]MDH7494796.1 ABC transporter ATP-binding protein [Bacillota bacterium]
MSRVDINHVWKVYPRATEAAVKDLTFTINHKEFLVILGPSGGGKSSTLRMLAGLEDITRGEIRFDGKVVNSLGPAERNVALAFESYALYQRLTVYENIAFPLRAKGMRQPEVHQKVTEIAERFGLSSVLKKHPSSLAGGQQQRVSLARALIRQPNLTLLDEPISHMDQRVRAEMRALIRHIHDTMGNTTAYVTHDQAEAIALCDRIAIINGGKLQQIGTIDEIWNRPANKFVAFFVGEPAMNFITGVIRDTRSVSIPTDQGARVFKIAGEIGEAYVGRDITVGVRPQQITVAREGQGENTIPAKVRLIEFRGEITVLTMDLSDVKKTEVKVVVPATERYVIGEALWLHWEPEIIHLFDGDLPITRNMPG